MAFALVRMAPSLPRFSMPIVEHPDDSTMNARSLPQSEEDQ
jgi:hypothetical protein